MLKFRVSKYFTSLLEKRSSKVTMTKVSIVECLSKVPINWVARFDYNNRFIRLENGTTIDESRIWRFALGNDDRWIATPSTFKATNEIYKYLIGV